VVEIKVAALVDHGVSVRLWQHRPHFQGRDSSSAFCGYRSEYLNELSWGTYCTSCARRPTSSKGRTKVVQLLVDQNLYETYTVGGVWNSGTGRR